MKKASIKKRFMALALCILVGLTSVNMPMSVSADTTTSEYLVQDDFSDATKTDETWTNTLSNKIQDVTVGDVTEKAVVVSGTTSMYMLQEGVIQSGDKPVQLQFSADHRLNTNTYTGEGFRFYLLKGANSDIILEYRKGNGAAVRIKSVSGFSTSSVTVGNDFKSGMDLTKKIVFTITYDWSDWANSNVTITIDLKYDGATSSIVTKEILFSHSGTDSDFNIGFYNSGNRKVCLYDVSLKTVNSVIKPFEETHSEILAKTADTIETSDITALQAALSDLSTYDTYVQGVINEKYPDLITMKDSLNNKIINTWDGLDDFSDSYRTSVLWTNSLEEKIVDETVVLDLASRNVMYELEDNIIEKGDKPLKLQYTVNYYDNTSTATSTNDGLKFYLLNGENSALVLLYRRGTGGTLRIDSTTSGFTTTDVTVGTDYYKSSEYTEHKIIITYDWSDWANKNVSITIQIANASKTLNTQKITFAYSGTDEEFNIGFTNTPSNDWTLKLDDIYLYTENDLIEDNETVRLYTNNSDTALDSVTWDEKFEVYTNVKYANVIIYEPQSAEYATEVEGYITEGKQVILTNNVEDATLARGVLTYAKEKSLPYIDMEAYGVDDVNVIAKSIKSGISFDEEGEVVFDFDESKMNHFLTPELYSATIKYTEYAVEQNLGFKTNTPTKTRTGTKIVSQGTIFAYYPDNLDDVDDVLAKMTLENAKDVDVTDVIYASADISKTSFIAGVSKNGGIDIADKYIARSYVEYDDGTVYYSVNTRSDKENSYENSTGVLNGYAVRSVISIAKAMVKDLYSLSANDGVTDAFDTATDDVVSSVDTATGIISWADGVTSNPDVIFAYIKKYEGKLQD